MKTFFFSVTLFLSFVCFAQVGVSSGSFSMIRSNGFNTINQQGFMPESSIIVEDFVNYHKHDIETPQNKKTQLSIYFNDEMLTSNNQMIIQVGLATKALVKNEKEQQVNVSLVIDKSGSMSSDNRLEKVKKAIYKFVEKLNESDFISIVTFDSNAKVLLNTQKVTKDKSNIFKVIESIYAGGSTNINEGLKFGYEELIKNHHNHINSKLILLTDGMTNQGEINPEIIIKNSLVYNQKGIDISTIGVGQTLDFDLLKQLAEAGRGSNHFIGSSEEDIQKVFIDEWQSLVYQIGKNPEVEIKLPKNYKLINLFGYQPQFIDNQTVKIKIENLGYASTQVFLMQVEKLSDEKLPIEAKLTYETHGKNFKENIEKNFKNENSSDIKKNYQIPLMAASLKKASKEYAQNNFGHAKTIMSDCLTFINKTADLKDKDIARVYDLLKAFDPNNFSYMVVK